METSDHNQDEEWPENPFEKFAFQMASRFLVGAANLGDFPDCLSRLAQCLIKKPSQDEEWPENPCENSVFQMACNSSAGAANLGDFPDYLSPLDQPLIKKPSPLPPHQVVQDAENETSPSEQKLKQDLAQVQRRVDRTIEQQGKLFKRLKEYKTFNEKLQKEYNILHLQNLKTQDSELKAMASVNKAEERNQVLQSRLDEMDEELVKLLKRLDEYRTYNQQLEHDYGNLNVEMMKAKSSKLEAVESVNKEKEEKQVLQGQLDKMKQEQIELYERLEEYRTYNIQLKHDCGNLKVEMMKIKGSKPGTVERVKKEKEEKQVLEGKLDEMEQELMKLYRRLDEYRTYNIQLEHDYGILSSEKLRIKTSELTTSENLKVAVEKNEALLRYIDDMEKEQIQLFERLEEYRTFNKELEAAHAKLKVEKENLKISEVKALTNLEKALQELDLLGSTMDDTLNNEQECRDDSINKDQQAADPTQATIPDQSAALNGTFTVSTGSDNSTVSQNSSPSGTFNFPANSGVNQSAVSDETCDGSAKKTGSPPSSASTANQSYMSATSQLNDNSNVDSSPVLNATSDKENNSCDANPNEEGNNSDQKLLDAEPNEIVEDTGMFGFFRNTSDSNRDSEGYPSLLDKVIAHLDEDYNKFEPFSPPNDGGTSSARSPKLFKKRRRGEPEDVETELDQEQLDILEKRWNDLHGGDAPSGIIGPYRESSLSNRDTNLWDGFSSSSSQGSSPSRSPDIFQRRRSGEGKVELSKEQQDKLDKEWTYFNDGDAPTGIPSAFSTDLFANSN